MKALRDYQSAAIMKTVIVRTLLYGLLVLWGAIVVVPVLWMVLSSLKPIDQILTPRIEWLPREIRLENYTFVWRGINIQRYFINSSIVSVVTMFTNILISSMAGYGLSKFNFRGRRLILLFILSSIMVPFQVIMIPLFIIVKNMGLINTMAGLIIPAAVTAFGVFLMRQTILPIPNDYCDSARIDGCSEFQIFLIVVIPLARVGVITLGLLSFLASWNNLIWPLLIIHKEELRTLALGLASLRGSEQYGNQYDKLMSVSVIMTFPIVLLYLIFNRFITRGITVGGLKG
jgi:multiple sugar transport system permease protein